MFLPILSIENVNRIESYVSITSLFEERLVQSSILKELDFRDVLDLSNLRKTD